MATAQEKFNQKLEEVARKVDQALTDHGEAVKAAVAAAVAAHEAEDEAAFEEATAKLDEIGDKLVADKPVFEPSGNVKFEPSGNTPASRKR